MVNQIIARLQAYFEERIWVPYINKSFEIHGRVLIEAWALKGRNTIVCQQKK